MTEKTNPKPAEALTGGPVQASVFASWPRVVLGAEDAANPGVPEHFGDPSGEQWALESGNAIVERGDLAALSVSGPDRLTWLTSISSQQLKGLKAGDSSELLILNAQGHIQQAAGVVDDGEQTWLITPRARADQFSQWLDSMRFMSRVDVARADVVIFETVVPRGISAQLNGTPPDTGASVDNSALSVSSAQHQTAEDDKKDDQLDQSASKRMNSGAETAEGSRLQAAKSAAESSLSSRDSSDKPPLTWVDPWPGVSQGRIAYFAGQHPASGHRVQLFILSAGSASEFVHAWLDADSERQPAGLLAAEALRVADWRPSIASDVDDRTLPAELDWLRTAVHTNKGCYPGQESVARILNMGRPPRRLTLLQLDGSLGDLPAPGAELTWEDRTVGTVTSVVRHADQGPIALALINRSVPADVVFVIDGVAAAQELIVPISGRPVGAEERSRPALKSNPALRHSDLRGAASGGLAPAASSRAGRGGAGRTQAPSEKAKVSEQIRTTDLQQTPGEQPFSGDQLARGVQQGFGDQPIPAVEQVATDQADEAATCACGRRTSPKETRKVSVSGEDFTPDGFVTTPPTVTTFGLGGGHGKRGHLSGEAGVDGSQVDRTPDGFVTTPAGATTFGLGGNKGKKHGGHHGGGGGLRLA